MNAFDFRDSPEQPRYRRQSSGCGMVCLIGAVLLVGLGIILTIRSEARVSREIQSYQKYGR